MQGSRQVFSQISCHLALNDTKEQNKQEGRWMGVMWDHRAMHNLSICTTRFFRQHAYNHCLIFSLMSVLNFISILYQFLPFDMQPPKKKKKNSHSSSVPIVTHCFQEKPCFFRGYTHLMLLNTGFQISYHWAFVFSNKIVLLSFVLSTSKTKNKKKKTFWHN